METLDRRNDLLLTASFANTLAHLAARLGDSEVCDERLLVELISLADRAEEALQRLDTWRPCG